MVITVKIIKNQKSRVQRNPTTRNADDKTDDDDDNDDDADDDDDEYDNDGNLYISELSHTIII